MDHIDLDDPGQREMAGFITGKFSMVKGTDDDDGKNDGNSTDGDDAKLFPRTSLEQQEYDRQTLEVRIGINSIPRHICFQFKFNIYILLQIIGVDFKEIGWTRWNKISDSSKRCKKNICKLEN